MPIPQPLKGRNILVVADEALLDDCEDGIKYVWMFDIREPTNPVSISTFPTPDEAAYCIGSTLVIDGGMTAV